MIKNNIISYTASIHVNVLRFGTWSYYLVAVFQLNSNFSMPALV
jgi:hypothetical protein